MFDHVGAVYRDDDPVPVELALDHHYDGIVAAWFDACGGATGAELQTRLAEAEVPKLLAGSTIEIASSWTPMPTGGAARKGPMDLGSEPGGAERLVQLFFVDGDVREALPGLRDYTNGVEAAGLADTRLVAPFLRTVVGTDRYVDELW
jgi:hypothetical protein